MRNIVSVNTKTGSEVWGYFHMRPEFQGKVIRLDDQSFDNAAYALEAPSEIATGSTSWHSCVRGGFVTTNSVRRPGI